MAPVAAVDLDILHLAQIHLTTLLVLVVVVVLTAPAAPEIILHFLHHKDFPAATVAATVAVVVAVRVALVKVLQVTKLLQELPALEE